MNRKQFLGLVAALLVLGGLGFALWKRDQASWDSAEDRAGQPLLKAFPVNDIAAINIKSAQGEVTLAKKDNEWQVKERGGYPANFAQLSQLLLKLKDLKVAQSEAIAPEQYARLELIEPGKEKDKDTGAAGTRVEFKDQAGKSIASLVLGKKYMRKAPGNEAQSFPAGRYVLASADAKSVALVSDPLLEVDAKAESWMAKEFFQVEGLKSVTSAGADGKAKWKVFREKDGAPWQLADKKAGEVFDPVNGTSIINVLNGIAFNDIATNANASDTGLDKPIVVTAETFDNLTYTLKIGKEAADNARYISVALGGEPNKTRTAAAGEKPEDKERLDKASAEKLKQLETRIKREQKLATWTYIIPNWRVEPLTKERAQLMAEKKTDKPGAAKSPGPLPPGMPPGAIPIPISPGSQQQ
jgi:hypothetical protein